MNVAASQSQSPAYRLKVSRYDRVSSMLLALVILLGVAVFVLLVAWLTNRIFLLAGLEKARGDCRHDKVVMALDAGNAVGMERIRLATQEEDS